MSATIIKYLAGIASVLLSVLSGFASPQNTFHGYNQGNILQFENISTEQGLSQSTVTAIIQDRQGFMWFGTEGGLNKYDGYQFTIYKHDPDNSQSLASNVISSIFEDHDGALWIGTIAGLDRLDRKTGVFIHFPQEFSGPVSLVEKAVLVINQDRSGLLWIGMDGGGLISADLHSNQFTVYKNNPDDPNSLSSNIVRSLYEDRSGELWVGTDKGLDQFTSSNGKFIHPNWYSLKLNSQGDSPVYSINEDNGGALWVGSAQGLFQWDRSSDYVNEFLHDSNSPQSLSDNSIRCIFKDSNGTLWIGTRVGLDELIAPQKLFIHYNHNSYDPQSLISDSIRTVYEDRSGVIWVGTAGGGISKYARATHKFALYKNNPNLSNSLSDNNIWSVYVDREENLWIGTFAAGLNKVDPRSGTVTIYKNNPADTSSLSKNDVRAILEDQNGHLWIGTEHGGLNRFDPKTGTFFHYLYSADNPTSLSSDSIFSIYQDREGRLWVGTQDGGLNLYNPATDGFTHYQHDENNPSSISNNDIRAILEDSTGAMWIGTFGGVDIFNPTSNGFVAYTNNPGDPSSLSSDLVFSLYEDPDGIVWVGTIGGGLNRYDRNTQSFSNFTEKNGLPDDTVYGILGGSSGTLWVSTNKGISNFNLLKETFRNYDVSDGLQGNQFNPGAAFESKTGEMFFGGTQGLNAFFPEQVNDNPVPPPLVITAFKKFNQTIQTDLGSTDSIQLSYRDSFISFEFSALDFNAPNKNQYSYKLDGFDQDWIQAGTRRYASYTNLPGGNYVFRVRGSNNDGVWNDAGIAITIHVTPPFWQTWWFAGTIIIALGALLTGGFRWRVNSIRKQNVQLEAMISNRTSELKETNQLLEKEVEQRKRAEAELENRASNELKLSEARFKAMFDNTSVGIALTTFDRKILQVNEAAARITGYSTDELLNMNPFDMAIPEDRVIADDTLQEMISGKRDTLTVERRYQRKNGDIFWGRVTYSLVRGPDRQPQYLIGLIEDINEQKIASEKMAAQEAEYLRTLEARVQERTRELSETNLRLVNEIEHRQIAEDALAAKAVEEAITSERTRLARDLHDAVTQTLFSASLIAEVLPEIWDMDEAEARKSTEELRQLTRGALAEMRTLLLELRPAALTQARFPDLIKQLSEALIGRARLPIHLDVVGNYEMPPEVKVAFYRIAQESLNNVVKYARATQVEIKLRLECCDVSLEIKDNGIGFDLSSIKPTSLGMRIMRERADAIHAHITFNSSPGQGTVVSLHWNEDELIPISKIITRGES